MNMIRLEQNDIDGSISLQTRSIIYCYLLTLMRIESSFVRKKGDRYIYMTNGTEWKDAGKQRNVLHIDTCVAHMCAFDFISNENLSSFQLFVVFFFSLFICILTMSRSWNKKNESPPNVKGMSEEEEEEKEPKFIRWIEAKY